MKYNYLIIIALILGMVSCSEDDTPSPDSGDNGGDGQSYHKHEVGWSARDLLASENYSGLTIEIIYAEGYEPTQEALDNLKNLLQNRINKPEGITISTTAISSPGLAPYSLDDIQQVEENNRSAFNNGDNLAVYGFIADGKYEQSDNVLGVAYRNTSFALFGSQIEENSGGLNEPSKALLESTVTNHELGHLLGLVNNGTPMQNDHQDEENGHHCDNDQCLMYWAAETGDIVSSLAGSDNPPPFDDNCKADLQAIEEQ